MGVKNESDAAIRYEPDAIDGMLAGLENKPFPENGATPVFTRSYNMASSMVQAVKNKLIKRNENILKCLYCLHHQAEKLENFVSRLENSKSVIGEFVLRDIEVFKPDLAPFTETSATNYMIQQYHDKFQLSETYFPLPESNLLSANQVDLKIMYKILSQPSYGFLKDEKFGGKNIFHVGISQILLNDLYEKA